MRVTATLSATFLVLAALFLSSCGLEPQTKLDKAELEALKGPDTGSIESSLQKQASQAESANDYRRAAQVYKQLADRYPAKAKYQVALAEALRRAGDNNASLRVLDIVLHAEPNNADALENKGLALMNTGETTEAAEVLGKVMKIDPRRWRTLNGIGILFAMKGKYDGAVAYFQQALDVSTDNPSVLNNAALTYAIDRKFDMAYDAFGRAKRHVDPGSPEMKHLDLNLALVYAVEGRLDDAEAAAAPHLSKAALDNNMGYYSYLAKNNEMAKTYLNMALTQSPVYYERAWKNLGALGDQSAMGEGTMPSPTTASSGPAAAPEAVALTDIPQSVPLHSDGTSPYAGTDEPVKPEPTEKQKKAQEKKDKVEREKEEKKKAAEEKKKEKAEKAAEKKKEKAKKDAGKNNSGADADDEKVPAPEVTPGAPKPTKDLSREAPGQPATGMNPDVILLKRPDAVDNSKPQPAPASGN